MVVIVLALVASLAWGGSDFLGGYAAGGAPLSFVLASSQLAGLLAFAPVLLLQGNAMPADGRLLIGFAAGAIAVAELSLIYLAIRRGPVVVVAPIAALGAALPVAVGIAGGDHVGPVVVAGLTCCLGGAAAAAWSPAGARAARAARRDVLTGAAIGGGAAIGAGTVLTMIDIASKGNVIWAIGAIHAGGAITATAWLGFAAVARASSGADQPRRLARAFTSLLPSRTSALAAVAVGLSDVVADTAYAIATRSGALSVVSVLASLYPITTIALGWFALRQRVIRVQLACAVLACAGIALLAATGA